MIFVGDDWAEEHHDIEVLDEAGATLARRRLPEGLEGVSALHALVAEYAEDPDEVVIGIETDRGLWVGSLVGAGYQVYAINPKVASRYRERHATSGAKSDRGDAKVLADLVRTDRHLHRSVAGDSTLAEAVKVLARAHQRLIWSRHRQVNALRATLREFYPAALAAFGSELAHPDALGVLGRAPTPARGRALSAPVIAATLRAGGRKQNVETRAAAIQEALCSPQLETPPVLATAFGASVSASVGVIAEMTRQLATLEAELVKAFDSHPDAEIIRSQPGLGDILGARVLSEFGDDPARYQDAKSRRRYAGTARSRRPRVRRGSCWPASCATAIWPTLAISGRSARSRRLPVPGSSMTSTGRKATVTPSAARSEQPPGWDPRRLSTSPIGLRRDSGLGPSGVC